MTTINRAPTPAEAAESAMADVMRLRAAMAEVSDALHATPEYQAYKAAEAAVSATKESQAYSALHEEESKLVESLKATLKATPGVIKTPLGSVGFQPRRELTYTAASVRAIVPALADLLVSESVDKSALPSIVKAAIKAGKVPEGALDQLQAAAEVKTTYAWTFKPLEQGAPPPINQPTADATEPNLADDAEVRKAWFAIVRGTALDSNAARAEFLGDLTEDRPGGRVTSLATFLSTATIDERRYLLTQARNATSPPTPPAAAPEFDDITIPF